MVTQNIKVISNVSLSIPYEDFVSLEQIVLAAERNQEYDDEHDTLTRTLVLGDEFSVQMNSRNFKTNIDPLFLNTILTCRHYYISLYYTAQRFGHVDALLRQVTSAVIECDKLWRFQRLNTFDAWDLENATNTQLIAPIARGCWFVRNRDYNAYNTLACVGNLKKSMKEGDMMTEEEILKLQQNTQQANMEAVAKINGELKEIRRELELSVFGAEKPAPKAFDPLTDTLPAEIDHDVYSFSYTKQFEDLYRLVPEQWPSHENQVRLLANRILQRDFPDIRGGALQKAKEMQLHIPDLTPDAPQKGKSLKPH